jgi:opacity protein-like surface antigen
VKSKLLRSGAIIAAVTIGLAVPALASDLPSRTRAPLFVPPVAVVSADTTGFYAAINGGGLYSVNTPDNRWQGSLGAQVGYDFGMVRLEGTYDRFGFDKNGWNAFQGNAILQYRIGAFTPYVLAGGGLATVDRHFNFDDSFATYNFGGGFRYSLAAFGLPKADIDLRYRHVGAAQFAHFNKDVVTLGFGYGF